MSRRKPNHRLACGVSHVPPSDTKSSSTPERYNRRCAGLDEYLISEDHHGGRRKQQAIDNRALRVDPTLFLPSEGPQPCRSLRGCNAGRDGGHGPCTDGNEACTISG